MRPSTAGALALCAILTACQTTDPYTGETKTSNATKGAAAGAVAGALIGAISGDEQSCSAAATVTAGMLSRSSELTARTSAEVSRSYRWSS